MLWCLVAITGLVSSKMLKESGAGSAAAAFGALFAFALLEACEMAIFKPYAGFGIVAGGHAAVAAILFAAPAKGAKDTAYAVVGGHVVATIAYLLQLAIVPASCVAAYKTLIVALCIYGQKAAGAVHPPAVAFAFLSVMANKGAMDAVGPIIGCALLVAFQQTWIEVTKDKKA